jgi:hypothetical protein
MFITFFEKNESTERQALSATSNLDSWYNSCVIYQTTRHDVVGIFLWWCSFHYKSTSSRTTKQIQVYDATTEYYFHKLYHLRPSRVLFFYSTIDWSSFLRSRRCHEGWRTRSMSGGFDKSSLFTILDYDLVAIFFWPLGQWRWHRL